MNCEEVQSLLADYDEDLLNPVSGYPIGEHVKHCNACSKELEELRKLFKIIAESGTARPSAALKVGFEKMLSEEIDLINKEPIALNHEIVRTIPWNRYIIRVAAAVVVFVAGTWFGHTFKTEKPDANTVQMNDLRNEVKDVKEMLMFSLLDEESASQRIKAVNYADEISNPDQRVLQALVHTLNNDKNVNVRLASLYSLGKFANIPLVRDSLVNSLGHQSEPVIQVMLINLLAEKKEVKARAAMRDMITKDNTIKEVKQAARQGLRSL